MRPKHVITMGLIGALTIAAGFLTQVTVADAATSKPRNKQSAAARGVKSQADAQSRDLSLRLGERSFDLAQGLPMDLPLGWHQSRQDVHDLRLVQLTGPTQQAWLDQLEALGLQVVQYIDPYTYITWGMVDNRAQIEALPFVRAMGDFPPAFRVQPQYLNRTEATLNIRALIYRGTDTNDVVRELVKFGGKSTGRSVLNSTWEIATFEYPNIRLVNAANTPGVYAIHLEPTDGGLRGEMSAQVCAGNVSGTNAAFPGYQTWLSSIGLNGTGVIIANVDGGIQDSHPVLSSRLVACSGSSCGGSAQSSHGTHTAGIMAGTGGSLDSNGFLRGLGVAPGANLVEQVYSPTFTQAGGMLELMKQSYANGALLSGNSWGPAGTPRGYDDDTLQVDIGVRDTNSTLAGDQPLTYVLSIMNGNGGTSTQGTPDEGKNIFTIGSTKMQNTNLTQILAINDLSSNSAHGPALDGRAIPHMVAPGCYVDSSTTSSSYTTMCGTSMASPHVSGAVALFIQYYRSLPGYVSDPSPALVKAAFLPVSHDLAGRLDANGGTLGHPLDNKQGWGRMNLAAVVAPDANGVRYFDQSVLFNNTGEEWSQTFSPLDPSKPVKIMLAWTDAPGHGLGGSTPAWNNNLDLEVTVGGSTYKGNVFNASGWSMVGGSADIRNNTEAVYLGPTAPASFSVKVKATNITSNGVPNVGDATDQDFALVVYNGAVEPGFSVTAAPVRVDLCAPANAVYTVNTTSILGFSQPITFGATNHPAGTTVNFSPNPVTPGSSTTMTVSNTGAGAPGVYTIQIDGVASSVARNTSVELGLYSGAPAAPSLTAPSNGSSGTPLLPTLTWSGGASASDYLIQVSTNPSFTNIVYSANDDASPHTVTSALNSLTQYYWRVRGSNICGNGSYSTTFSFTTLDTPAILLVDDDDNAPDVRPTYIATLNALGVTYDIWNTNNTDNEPSAAQLAPYKAVIWFTGDEFGGAAGPGPAGEAALATWLQGGGCLFISSQDYLWDRGGQGIDTPTSFMVNYLGVGTADSDVNQTSASGTGLYSAMGPYSLSYPFTNYSDILNANASGAVAFVGNAGNSAVSKDGGVYRTVFLGFPHEAISTAAGRQAVMQKFLDWCGELFPPQPTCPLDFLPAPSGDGFITIAEINAILLVFGTNCSGCPEDVSPTGGDGEITIADVVTVLSAFGPCP